MRHAPEHALAEPTRWLSPMLTPRLPRAHQIMVKKAGEPCTLYCKGRILGYKR